MAAKRNARPRKIEYMRINRGYSFAAVEFSANR